MQTRILFSQQAKGFPNFCLVPMLRRGNPYGMHSHAGAWEREKKSPNNDVAVSVVTFCEISLKYALGKLELIGVKPEELPGFAAQMNLEILPITAAEASSFHKLPRLSHKDPFDRIIIWQAI